MRRVPHPDAPGLEAFVDDPGDFLTGVLFQRARCWPSAHVQREVADVATADGLWVDALARGIRAPMFRLVRHGATLAASSYTRTAGVGHRTIDDVIEPNRVLELYDGGATVVLQGLQLTDAHVAKVANNLALTLDHPVQINAYLSPPSARGLDLHFDYHDVFVLQLDGAKRWRVWEPLERTREPVKSAPKPAPLTFEELGAPVLDLTLQQGDCLYLPRGYPHSAETVDDASAHLTVGILAVTWQQALRGALDAAVDAGAWRGSIPAGTSSALRGSADLPVDLVASLQPYLDPGVMRRWLVKTVWRRQPATRLRPRAVQTVDLTTPVHITPGPLVWLDVVDGRATLGLGDRELTMPAEAHGFLAELMGSSRAVAACDLVGGLDDASKVAIARRLAVEGMVAPG